MDKETENQMLAIGQEALALSEQVTQLTVTNEDQRAAATILLSEVKAKLKKIEDTRKFFTAPLNKQQKDINALFGTFSTPLEKSEALIKSLIKGYMMSNVDTPDVPMTMRTSAGMAITKKLWTFRVVNPGLVPREYLDINPSRVMKEINEGVRSIPGLDIFEDLRIDSRMSKD